ncbi:hypothetical protein CANARDRAFT_30077 [[Candida] arabinofermentans NRRL YB-2248]|uniref:AAA+ ATPase domain-containing protein n=1 Tax=[Candida] arabinofermentans NRRL YB-2248 TaxID=983967 RepID=A0A1E4SUV1_9ASCO|nr:hypothetical protein CANARDRAFT_30077 [[Candida] arabinofermentans NRRL YB-2248]
MDPIIINSDEPDIDQRAIDCGTRKKKTPLEIFKMMKSRDEKICKTTKEIDNSENVVLIEDDDSPVTITEEKVTNLDSSSLMEPPKKSVGVSIASILGRPKTKTVKVDPHSVKFKVAPEKLKQLDSQKLKMSPDKSDEPSLIKQQIQVPEVIEISDTGYEPQINTKVNPLSFLKGGRFDIRSTKLKSDTLLVTLKVNPEKLQKALQVKITPDVQHLSQVKNKELKPLSSFFNEVSSRVIKANSKSASMNLKHEREQRLLEVPVLRKDHFLIYDKADDSIYDSASPFLTHLTKKAKPQGMPDPLETTISEHEQFMSNYKSMYGSLPRISTSHIYHPDTSVSSIASKKYKNVSSHYPHLLRNNFSNMASQWCDLFRPTSHTQILQPESVRTELFNWITQSYKRLKRVDRNKRANLLKKKSKAKRGKSNTSYDDDSLADFIDDDSFDSDATEYDEDLETQSSFVPSLIIEGPTGCGKTSALYAIVKEELKGFIFELNCGQGRAKKDIIFHLKQIGTTSVVNGASGGNDDGDDQDHEENDDEGNATDTDDGEKGLILFDDVDLIDEAESDKDFWSGVVELLTLSYRPVVFTTSDLSCIPSHILNESTVYRFSKVKEKSMVEYLDLVGLNMGVIFDSQYLERLAKERDLRGALQQLQLKGYSVDKIEGGLVEIKEQEEQQQLPQPIDKGNDLDQLLSLSKTYEYKYSQSTLNPTGMSSDFTKVQKKPTEVDKYLILDFYTTKYTSSSSRHKTRRYFSSQEYLDANVGSVFNKLPVYSLNTDVTPFIKEMARVELIREQMATNVREQHISFSPNSETVGFPLNGGDLPRKRFDADPVDYFDDLF